MSAVGNTRQSPPQGGGNGAIIVGAYRYLLWRTWNERRPHLLWILLNPSTADGETDDQTLRRCIAFSQAWQYGGLEIVNLFAFRTSRPQDVRKIADPVGPDNDHYIAAAAARAVDIVVAWREGGAYQQRDRAVLALLAQCATPHLFCLGTVQSGRPRHPLRIAGCTARLPYELPTR